ncbi:MAG: hypothetical protein NOF05_02095 [Candidatus Accumulibacter phosphatis]|uniref:Uncharacterized protein n=2 Tax=Candidatus Accumulibacter TaxID=327159 RepID=A0A080M2J2_9PROT|nr:MULTISPECIES: hypothetical protein [Candidatus Accumulibacter]KFB75286.1 MAG: hypothetical protein AW06_003658 [Candidatus Accumulibacter cognatus]MBL8402672.1 hypothetical protein [Accumulibacter sp.]MBN8517168.1 hypothetical protein [Accumulibacter sp.]MBO3711397.1 hypothetical protein [Accumulibacter sp.]MCC2868814.1 hypothetical protein [Candidatus Accumulibacter phosphatis]
MNDTPTDPARLTAVVDYHTVGSLLREVLFPPMTVGIFLTRAGSGLLGLAAWMVTALAIAMVLMRFDVARTTAGMVGVVTPVIVVIVLNSLGVFNRRGAGAKPLRQFHEWLLAVASRGMGLEATHIVAAHVDADQALQLQVSDAWLQQPADKRLRDLSQWCYLWNWSLVSREGTSAVRIVLHDANGQTVGGTGPQGGDEVWLAY